MTALTRLAGALFFFSMALPTPSRADCSIGSAEMPVRMKGGRAIATVTLNGTPTPLIVDSGAFFSTLSDSVTRELKLPVSRTSPMTIGGIGGEVKVGTATVQKMGFLGTLAFPNVQFLVHPDDFDSGTRGLLGRNVLAATDVEYDLAHGVIRFLFPSDGCAGQGMAYWAGTLPVSQVDLVDDGSQVPPVRAYVNVNGSKTLALFDTGATTIVSKRAAARAGVGDADYKSNGTMRGVGKRSIDASTVMIKSFEVGGETISDSRLEVAEIGIREEDMLVGIEFFLSHRIYVSRLQKKMYFTYNGGPVFFYHRSEEEQAAFAAIDPVAMEPLKTADDYARRGASLSSRREYRSALADLDRACELDPASAAYRAARGDIQMASKHPELALADYDAALELDPSLVETRLARAEMRSRLQDRAGALADLQAIDAGLSPESPMRLQLSSLYTSARSPDAIRELDRWLATHPRDFNRGNVLNDRCWARVVIGLEFDKALVDCNDAVETDSHQSFFLDSRAWLHLRMGQYKSAMADFDQAIQYSPELANSLYGRGLAEAALGDATRSEADIAQARKADSDIESTLTQLGLIPDTVLTR